MFWYIAQLLLLLHICLSRDGNLEESIHPKRVISYPTQKDLSRYERKNFVETFHNTMKTIFPPFPINETDYRSPDTKDSRQSGLSLKSEQSNDFEGTKDRKRRGVEILKSLDGMEEDGNVQSEPDSYSMKEIAKDGDPSEISSDALLESLLDDILIERPTTLRKRALVFKKLLPKDPRRNRPSTKLSKTSISKRNSKNKKKDKSRGMTVWKLETDLVDDDETVDSPDSNVESNLRSMEKPPSNNHARKSKCSGQPGKNNNHSIKRKCLSESDDDSTDDDGDTEAVTQLESDLSVEVTIESKVDTETSTENILSSTEDTDIDQDQLILSLLPYLPDDDDDDTEEVDSTLTLTHEEKPQQPQNGTSGAPHFLVLCIFGALSLLGIALLIMGIYTIAIKYVSQRRYSALKAAKDPLAKQNMSRINLADGLRPKKTVSNPKDVRFLLHAFLDVLEKNPVPPNETLNQKYRSHAHFKLMKRITRKTKIHIKHSL